VEMTARHCVMARLMSRSLKICDRVRMKLYENCGSEFSVVELCQMVMHVSSWLMRIAGTDSVYSHHVMVRGREGERTYQANCHVCEGLKVWRKFSKN